MVNQDGGNYLLRFRFSVECQKLLLQRFRRRERVRRVVELRRPQFLQALRNLSLTVSDGLLNQRRDLGILFRGQPCRRLRRPAITPQTQK